MAKNVMTGSFAEASAKLNASLEASRKKFTEDLGRVKEDFEINNAKFNSELDSLSPKKSKASPKPNSSDKWTLSRKIWEWLYRE